MHEVVVSESTLKAVEASQKAGRSLWRVSSTVSFSTLNAFVVLHIPATSLIGFSDCVTPELPWSLLVQKPLSCRIVHSNMLVVLSF